MASMLKMKKTADPKQEITDALKPFCQFNTSQEFKSLVENLCYEKDLKMRIKEMIKYRENGLMDSRHLVSFEKLRFKRELKKRPKDRKIGGKVVRLLPRPGDYSLQVPITKPFPGCIRPTTLLWWRRAFPSLEPGFIKESEMLSLDWYQLFLRSPELLWEYFLKFSWYIRLIGNQVLFYTGSRI